MSFKATTEALDSMLSMLKSDLDGGTIYVFAGPLPADAGAALDMSQHTQVAVITADGNGVTFAPPEFGVLSKDPNETWDGLVEFEGAQDGETSLSPTFFRLCPSGDDGRSETSAPRLQGTAGGPSSSADMKLTGMTVTANGTNRTGAAIFNVRLTSTQ